MITITKKSPFSGNINSMELPLTEKQWVDGELARANGALIQDVYSQLNPDQREFIMTGITPNEWEATFGTE